MSQLDHATQLDHPPQLDHATQLDQPTRPERPRRATGPDHAAYVRRETLALAAAADGHLRRRVPGCPGWEVADLVHHLTEVQWFWRTIVEGALTEPPPDEAAPPRADDDRLIAGLRAGGEQLAAVLADADPDRPCWTWADRQDIGFVIRHQAQEAAVHRWDAEQAVSGGRPIDATLAVDAIEEWLEISARWARSGQPPLAGAVTVRGIDADVTWTLVEGPEHGLRILAPGEAAATVAVGTVSGTTSDLLLGLYRRVGAPALRIEGDPTAWASVTGDGVQ